MKVYSGGCLMGRCGLPTDIKDACGEKMFVGDIVALVSEHGFHGLTVIVEDGITTYHTGHINITEGSTEKFVMGIKSIDLDADDSWWIVKAKSYSDVVDGEHWKDYGFNYKED